MKRCISIFLLGILIILFIPISKVNACGGSCCNGGCSDTGVGHLTNNPWPNMPYVGIAIGGLAILTKGSLYVAQKLSGVPVLTSAGKNWSGVYFYTVDKSLKEGEVQGFLVNSNTKYNLLTKAVVIADKDSDKIFEVKNLIPDYKNHRIVLLPDSQIKNDTMHLYYIKLPQELQKSKIQLKTTFLYDAPKNIDMQNDRFSKLNYHLFRDAGVEKAIKNVSKNNYDRINEQTRQIKTGLKADFTSKQLGMIQKDFIISNAGQKSVILAIARESTSKKANVTDYAKNYAVVVDIAALR